MHPRAFGLLAGAVMATMSLLAPSIAPAQSDQANRPLWLRHPAISPDGSRIAFVYRGQIWIVPSKGGDATALTGAPFYSSHPVWSPDGARIAFSSDRHGNPDVFVMSADGGAATRLTYHSASDRPMAFSPDGSLVYFDSNRLGDPVADAIDSHKGLGGPLVRQLYTVPATGGRAHMIMATPASDLAPSGDGTRFLYTGFASIENEWRKHQVSDAAHDIWTYSPQDGTHRRLTEWRGEDRDPSFAPDGTSFYWLSERSGSFNVWRRPIEGGEARQVTFHERWPVRFLSSAGDGTLAYAWNGEIWLLAPNGDQPKRVDVHIRQGNLVDGPAVAAVNQYATEIAVSPNGTELALVARGEVFVMPAAGGTARRITSTPAAERFVSFSPDGRAIIYASDRDGDWDIYETRLLREADKGFSGAAPVEERLLIDSDSDSYQPLYSPAGDRIAYVDERSAIRVFDVAAGTSVEVLPVDAAYSYSDGDMSFAWSPNGRWLVARTGFGSSDISLIDAGGTEPPRNLSMNGYTDVEPSVSSDGNIVTWVSDRNGLRTAILGGVQKDVYAAFLSQEAYDAFKLPQQQLADAGASANPAASADEGLPDTHGLELRTERLTPFSSPLQFQKLTPDNRHLVFVSVQDNGTAAGYMIDLATHAVRQVFTRRATREDFYVADAKVSTLYLLSGGTITRYGLADGKQSPVAYQAEVVRDVRAEVAYIFEHDWRATKQTFYLADMQGTDWDAVGAHYRKFVPHIVHWEDLAELLSEMQGELNASHQGTIYRAPNPLADQTASLGLYYDQSYRGEGMKIAAAIPGGPADRPSGALVPGATIMAVDGEPVTADIAIDSLLNRRAGQPVLLTVRPAEGGETVSETVTPVSLAVENELAYQRWVARRREIVERLSGGRIGYIHVRGMSLGPYQQAYGELFGRYRNAEAVIVDIRSNGGGNLHDQLVVMLTGSHDSSLVSRGGTEIVRNPTGRFTGPSALLVNASSYSDASVFPMLYQQKGIGTVIGERVPGTGTARTEVPQIQTGLHYTVPELGFRLNDGRWLENTEVVPDISVYNDPQSVAAGRDMQLERAVEHLKGVLAR